VAGFTPACKGLNVESSGGLYASSVQYGFALGLHSYFSDEGLLVFNLNWPFDTKAHDRPFDKGLTRARIQYSMLDVQCSMFISFFFDLTIHFSGQRRL
jgi:hypothetical protein